MFWKEFEFADIILTLPLAAKPEGSCCWDQLTDQRDLLREVSDRGQPVSTLAS